ncbi:MAG: hypothetical protein GY862_17145, partial [Gammaproteobacteria bacterium]|nr:hypothetical protein [Gammaproteobacteria bacterium]
EIRGKADWNSAGLSAIQNKEYKFYSPAFLHDSQNRIVAFSSFGIVGVQPVIAPKSGLDDKTPPDGAPALNKEERKLCTSLGISEEDLRKTLKELA